MVNHKYHCNSCGRDYVDHYAHEWDPDSEFNNMCPHCFSYDTKPLVFKPRKLTKHERKLLKKDVSWMGIHKCSIIYKIPECQVKNETGRWFSSSCCWQTFEASQGWILCECVGAQMFLIFFSFMALIGILFLLSGIST
jgi:hypothetical protein